MSATSRKKCWLKKAWTSLYVGVGGPGIFLSSEHKLSSCVEKAPASYRAISGTSGPKSQKSQKRVKKESPGPSGPRGPSPKRVKNDPFWEGPGDSFLTRFDSFGISSVAGGGFLKSCATFRDNAVRFFGFSCRFEDGGVASSDFPKASNLSRGPQD